MLTLAMMLPTPAAADARGAHLVGRDTAEHDRFGFAVAVDADTLLVGAILDDTAATDAGRVYVFAHDGSEWSEESVLQADDAQEGDRFGFAVAIEGRRVVVGAPEHASGAGAAYVFERASGAWRQRARLTPETSRRGARFGASVGLSGDAVAVGAPDHNEAAGAVYVFRLGDGAWMQGAELSGDDVEAQHEFGTALAFANERLLIGSPGVGNTRERAGAAYVFEWNGSSWRQEAKLLPDEPSAQAGFGSAVAIEGNRALVGAPRDDAGGTVHVFSRNDDEAWTLEERLTADDTSSDNGFGASVAVSDGAALVGSYLEDAAGRNSGAAYVFLRGDGRWSPHGKWVPEGASAGDRIGEAVALDADRAILGAPFDNATGPGSGSAWLYELAREAGDPCTDDTQCVGGLCSDNTCCASDCRDDMPDAGTRPSGEDASTISGSDSTVGEADAGPTSAMHEGGCNCTIDGTARNLRLGWPLFGLLVLLDLVRRRRPVRDRLDPASHARTPDHMT